MTYRVQANKSCPQCDHPGAQHFQATDAIGYWAFCMWQTCNCFIEDMNDEPTSTEH